MDIFATKAVYPKRIDFPSVAIINMSSKVKNSEMRAVTRSLQIQVLRDFIPIWGIAADIEFYEDEKLIPVDAWKIIVLDTEKDAEVMGYHELTEDGYPQGKVYVDESVNADVAWSITLSHELLELLVDPYTDLLAMHQLGKKKVRLYAYEVCDPVQNDWYVIGGVKVSNFVYPEWFESDAKNLGGKWDFLAKLKAPFTLTEGGYASYIEVVAGGWKEISARTKNEFEICRKNREFPEIIGAKVPFFKGLWVKIKKLFTGYKDAIEQKKTEIEIKK